MMTQSSVHPRSGAPPLRERVALVTGASSGIGFATAVALAETAAVVVVHYRANLDGARRAAAAVEAAGAQSVLHRADLTHVADVEAMGHAVLERCGRLDILINNAGSTERVPILECTPTQWESAFRINLDAAFHCTRAFLPGMVARGWGRVVNISSIVSLRGGDPQETVHYAAAKTALNVYSQGLARAVARSGVTVNVVAPGYVDTPLQDQPGRRPIFTQKAGNTPVGRPATPQEVAAVVRFVASDAASYLVGEVVSVSGGL